MGGEEVGWPGGRRLGSMRYSAYDAKLGTYSFTETPDLSGHLFTTWAADHHQKIKRRRECSAEVHLPIRPEI